MFVVGDRNITNGIAPRNTILELRPDRAAGWTEAMHNGQGNVGLVDGSVQGLNTPRYLSDLLKHTGDTTNRIALPE
jgi:prepilin-type processing-associated H-X9-DG protein